MLGGTFLVVVERTFWSVLNFAVVAVESYRSWLKSIWCVAESGARADARNGRKKDRKPGGVSVRATARAPVLSVVDCSSVPLV